MSDKGPIVSPVPRASVAEIAAEITLLKAMAETANLATVVYLLEMALVEARHQDRLRERVRRERECPKDAQD